MKYIFGYLVFNICRQLVFLYDPARNHFSPILGIGGGIILIMAYFLGLKKNWLILVASLMFLDFLAPLFYPQYLRTLGILVALIYIIIAVKRIISNHIEVKRKSKNRLAKNKTKKAK